MCSSKILHPGGIIEQKITPKPLQKLLPTNHIKKVTGESKPEQNTLLTAPSLNATQKVNQNDPFFVAA